MDNNRSPRVLFAGIFHETHTFLEGRTTLEDCVIRKGDELIRDGDDASPMSGALEMADKLGWSVVPSIDIRAMPGPVVSDSVVDLFWNQIEQTLNSPGDPPDALYLVLHGAMVSESIDDVEGVILARLRSRKELADTPIGGVVDLHANFTPQMADLSDCLVGYRKNPHTDAKQAASDAAELLNRTLQSKERPRTVYLRCPLMWPPTGTGTDDSPMRELESRARQIEQDYDEILSVSVYPGFAFADTPFTGLSMTAVTTGPEDAARDILQTVSDLAWAMRYEGIPQELSAAEAIGRLEKIPPGPVVLAEPSDNIGGGAPGDGTCLLREMVTSGVQDGVVVINDPEAIQHLADVDIGKNVCLDIGGRGRRLDSGPFELDVVVESKSDGRFRLEDPQSHLASMFGSEIDMGDCAVVRHEGIWILLTSKKTPPFDLGQLRSQGIHPEKMRLIAVKAAVAHRRAYDPIATASFTVDTPGPCSSNLSHLPYTKVQRPIFPLDP